MVEPHSWQPPERRARFRRQLGQLADGWRAWQEPRMTCHCYLLSPDGQRETISYTALLAWERRGWVRRRFARCVGAATERREWALTERGRDWAMTGEVDK